MAKQGILWLLLDQPSVRLLRQAFPPRFKNEFYHHITLAYNVSAEEVSAFIGQEAVATVYAYASNNKVEAVRVRTANLPDTYGVPHITLSTQVGIKPVESVTMLRANHKESPLTSPMLLHGKIEFVAFDV